MDTFIEIATKFYELIETTQSIFFPQRISPFQKN